MIEKLLSSEVQKFIKDHQNDDPFLLSLKFDKEAGFPIKKAIEQIQSGQKAKSKLPTWYAKKDIIWPAPVSVEQSSSELTAKFKASLVSGRTIADFTGGMGVDTCYFADQFEKVVYIEPNPDLSDLAKHNFSILGREVLIIRSTAEEFVRENKQVFDAIYLDPSRRVKTQKVFKIEDCAPNLYQIVPECVKIADQVLIKLSPLVDLSLLVRDFGPNNIWVVAVKGEVKEVLCLIGRDQKTVKIHAVDLFDHDRSVTFDFNAEEESQTQSQFSFPLQYLYEPNAAILKAGAFKLIGKNYQLYKLHQHSHLYTSDVLVKEFPGKILKIRKSIGLNKKDIHKSLPSKIINVITRNFSLDAGQLKKKVGLKDGGDQFLVGTTIMDSRKVLLICDRLG
jgi:predicted O-methyltransferase YrrM